jgi:RNA polymerase sigma-70 factor (ECF subfamily)
MQQTLMDAFKSRDRLLEVDQVRGWLLQIARSRCVDALRSGKRADRLQQAASDASASETPDPSDKLAATDQRRALQACLDALEPEIADAVMMRYREGMSWQRIAEIMGTLLDTVRIRVSRGALKRLRACLEAKGIEP